MDKRKIGVTIVVIALILGAVLVNLITDSSNLAEEKSCFQDNECSTISYTLSASHLGIGIIFALAALGLYRRRKQHEKNDYFSTNKFTSNHSMFIKKSLQRYVF